MCRFYGQNVYQPRFYVEPRFSVEPKLWNVLQNKQKEEKSCDFSSVVAGVGIEPHDLRVMSPTSYQLLYPAILDCKYTDIF